MGGRGSGGKNRKAIATKKAEGNRGRRSIKGKRNPESLAGEPEMPDFVEKDPTLRIVWAKLIPVLAKAEVLRVTDGIAIGALCSNYVLFAQADANIRKMGSVIVTELDVETGVSVLKVNPSVRVRAGALKELRAGWQAFGLDPASAAGVQLPDDPENPRTGLDGILDSEVDDDEVIQ